ncbi:MAG: hypothetical protein H7Z14_14490 [Anaerolineae bacterium]|nr:hypothetical protein [Phycisphaerae bacterium]
MLETFLILLAGGVMLAVAISSPRDVTLQWLRLAGILGLVFFGVGISVYLRREWYRTLIDRRELLIPCAVSVGAILLQLACAQTVRRTLQRCAAAIAVVATIATAAVVLHGLPGAQNRSIAIEALTCFGVAAMCGIALMDMLLGHAYLTAAQMTMAPFRRLNFALAATLIVRAICATVIVMILHRRMQVESLWSIHGLYIGTRWLVGLLVPAVFVYMAHDCIKRRATQSATGILYVAGVLIFLGEIVALQLVRETGLPF